MVEHKVLKVIIFSGLSFSGKSTYLDWLLTLEEFGSFKVFRVDDVRCEIFGNANITLPEHFFKNEEVWHRTKKALVVDRVSVINEMPLLDREQYHEPLLKMLDSAQSYLEKIRLASPEGFPFYSIELVIISLHCDVETILRRIVLRKTQKTNSDVLGLERMRVGVTRMELPNIPKILFLNTSGETSGPSPENQSRILRLIHANQCPPDLEHIKMREDARWHLEELREAIFSEIKTG